MIIKKKVEKHESIIYSEAAESNMRKEDDEIITVWGNTKE